MILEAASPLKRWAVVCQAREDSDGNGRVEVTIGAHGVLGGDAMSSELVLGASTGQRIDELAAFDPLGRWLVVRRAERMVLVDAMTAKESELVGADARSDRAAYRGHRAVAFDSSGKRLLWVRRDGPQSRIVVRDLESGVDHEIDPGPGELWRAELSQDGNWAVIQVILEDSNKNGRLDWPVPPGSSRWRCQGPAPHFDSWIGRGDAVSFALAPVTEKAARVISGFATTLGRDYVTRDAKGNLLLLRSLDKPAPLLTLASHKCGGRVFDADAARGIAVIACVGAAPTGRPELMLVGSGFRQLLGVRVAPFAHDREPGPARRLLPIYSGRDTMLLDFEARRIVTLAPGDLVVTVDDASALVRRNDSLLLHDVGSATSRVLVSGVSRDADPITAEGATGIAAVQPFVVDLKRQRVVGRFQGRALSVAYDGSVLIAQGADATADRLAVGPAVWRVPISETSAPP